MIRNVRLAAVTLVVMLAVGSAGAQSAPSTVTLHFDPAGTKINWTLKDLLHTVRGTFRLKDGLIVFDEETGAVQGEIIVETDSGESGNSRRNRRMQKDVLESAKYPEAIFHPEKVTGVIRSGQSQTITVAGTFTIHGADHPMALQVQTVLNGDTLTAKTHFAVPYVAWGMKYPSTLMLRVAKEVQVEVDARASLK